ETKARVERPTGGRQQATDAGQIDRVVGVPAIGRTAPRRNQAGIPQLAQVVRDQVLRLIEQAGELVHHAVAPGQLTQQTPTQRMPRDLQELGWGEIGVNLLYRHVPSLHQLDSMHQTSLVDSGLGGCLPGGGAASPRLRSYI